MVVVCPSIFKACCLHSLLCSLESITTRSSSSLMSNLLTSQAYNQQCSVMSNYVTSLTSGIVWRYTAFNFVECDVSLWDNIDNCMTVSYHSYLHRLLIDIAPLRQWSCCLGVMVFVPCGVVIKYFKIALFTVLSYQFLAQSAAFWCLTWCIGEYVQICYWDSQW